MTGDPVPNSDHVARYAGGQYIAEDGRVTSQAFALRPGERYLSANWLEVLEPTDRVGQIRKLRQVMAAKGRQLGATAKFAVLQVGETRRTIRQRTPDRRSLNFLHEPEARDDSHVGIYGLSREDDILCELLAQSVIETWPARG